MLEAAAAEQPGLFPQVMDVTSGKRDAGHRHQHRAAWSRDHLRANAGIAEDGRCLTPTAFWRRIVATNLMVPT